MRHPDGMDRTRLMSQFQRSQPRIELIGTDDEWKVGQSSSAAAVLGMR